MEAYELYIVSEKYMCYEVSRLHFSKIISSMWPIKKRFDFESYLLFGKR